MAKWTITFEDVKDDNGGPAVAFEHSYKGDPMSGDHWSMATACAMFLSWAWQFAYFQRAVVKYGERVAKHHIESSTLSDEG